MYVSHIRMMGMVYFGSSVSSSVNDVNMCQVKAWTTIG